MDGGNNSTYIQAVNWNNCQPSAPPALVPASPLPSENRTDTTPSPPALAVIGSGTFCTKLCFNNVTSPDYCENTLDLLGCAYNMPSANTDGEFVKCDGDLQDVVGRYTGTDGKTSTWSQPSSLPATSTLPWTPRVPASSNCVTYKSADLFGAASSSAAATSKAGGSKTSSGGAKATGSVSGSGSPSSGASALNAREVVVGLGWVGAVVAAVAGAAVLL